MNKTVLPTEKRRIIATVNRYLSLLGSCFTLAEANGKVDKNPYRSMRLEKENNISDRIMTYEEEDQLLKVVSLKFRPMVKFAVLTAMRPSSQRKLEWKNVNLNKGTMVLRGVKDLRSTAGKDVVIQMMPEVVELLNTLPQRIDCPKVFYNFPSSFRLCKLFKQWTGEAGVEGLTWTRLRNPGISRMYEGGVDIYVIQSQAGHSSREMTERYTSPSEAHKKEELEKYSNSILIDITTDTKAMGN